MTNARCIHVLLVDDNPLMRKKLQGLLIKHPNIHIVDQASNWEEALECVRILRPKVVLININVPGMDAVLTTRQIRMRYPTIVIIGLNVTTEENQHLERSKRQKDTAKRFRALGEPLLHAILKSRDPGDNTLRPRERAC